MRKKAELIFLLHFFFNNTRKSYIIKRVKKFLLEFVVMSIGGMLDGAKRMVF